MLNYSYLTLNVGNKKDSMRQHTSIIIYSCGASQYQIDRIMH
jgi:hypothetical protein